MGYILKCLYCLIWRRNLMQRDLVRYSRLVFFLLRSIFISCKYFMELGFRLAR